MAPYFAFVPLVFVVPALVDSEKTLGVLAAVLVVGALADGAP